MPIEFFPDDKFNNAQTLEFDEEALEKYRKSLVMNLMIELKKEVINNVIPSLGPLNFRGEAINYMKQEQIPITEAGIPGIKGVSEDILGIKQYSQLMLKSFVDNVDSMIIYDEESNCILISPFIEAFEFGDLYRPILRTITRSIETAFSEL